MSRSKRRAKTTIQNLPKEIMLDIFSRLPIQAISNCRFLCKDWFEYIAEPDFSTMHHNHENSRFLLLCRTNAFYRTSYWVNLPDNEELPISLNSFQSIIDPTPKKVGPTLKIIGSINGLLCLRYSDKKGNPEFHICNPITKDIFRLPKPPSVKYKAKRFRCTNSESGFGLDSTTNRYKVIHTWYFLKGKDEVLQTEVGIFTLGSKKWKTIQNITGCFRFMENQSQAFLHNALHFKIWSRDPTYTYCIGAIDIGSETFKTFKGLVGRRMKLYTLCRFEDRLCLSFHSIAGIVMWIMNEYGVWRSWTSQYLLKEEIIGSSFSAYGILSTKRDKRVLLLRGTDHGYYDLEKNEFQRIQIHGVPPYSCVINRHVYVLDAVIHIGSLISPKRLAATVDKMSTSTSKPVAIPRCTRSGRRFKCEVLT